MTDTDETAQVYKALHMLTDMFPPTVKGRPPYWRPKAAPISDDVRLPVWSWERPLIGGTCATDPNDTVNLDVNGAYLAACSSAPFAHSALTNDFPRDLSAPGLYLVDVHPWQEGEIVSPLGEQPFTDDRTWVAQPTVKLLDQLSVDGYWPKVVVHDGWTASSCRLRRWTDAVQEDRTAALRERAAGVEGAAEKYEAIKDGYSIAVQLMRGPAEGAKTKSSVRRPDWYQTVHAQHAASTWRKAWNAVLTGHGPVAMGSVDEITFTVEDLDLLMALGKPPFRLDATGEQIGALKIKRDEEE